MFMARAGKRNNRGSGQARAGANVFGLLLIVAAMLGGAYFLFPALMSGDLFWFSTEFNARPIRLAVVQDGARETINPDDARFLQLVDALNGSIERGYRLTSTGVSEPTWQRIDEHGLIVEATYAQPVELHLRGGFAPTEQLMVVFGGEDLHLDSVLFSHHGHEIGAVPLQLEDAAPLREALAQDGYTLE